MTPPRIRTRSGHRPRARLHANWSPAAKHRARRTLIRVLGVGGALFLLLAIGVNVYAVSFLDSLPSVDGLDSSQFGGDAIIFDRNGKQLADIGQHGDRRLNVTLDQVSPKLVQATVAVEDKNFWSNPGFDPEAIVRTVASNFRAGGITGGASTITQQLAKQQFLTGNTGVADRTFDRKLKELVLAYRLNQTYSKQKILELYFNKSYYGEQQYGVQAASLTYFKKNAKDLDLAQASLLAGLVRSPDLYDPVQHFDNAKERQKEVLDAMVRAGYITPQEERAAVAEHLDVSRPANSFLAPHFVQYVTGELQRLGFKPGQQQLKVVTTLDYNKQLMAEKDVLDNVKANLWHDRDGELNSSLVAMDPRTGQIIAFVGSPGYNDWPAGNYDFASGVLINEGSSVKLFTYAKAIADGKITMDTPIQDAPNPLIPDPKRPNEKIYNFDKRLHGNPPARVALASSYNIPAVKVEMAETIPAMVDWYRNLGMRPRADGNADAPNTGYGASLTLGGYPMTLLEEATALATMANMGMYHPAEAILQVTDSKGAPLYAADPHRGERRAVDEGAAFIIASILNDDNNRAPAFGLNSPLHIGDRRSAAKTGTNETFRSGLTIGFTPDLATAVWIGDSGGKDTPGVQHTLTGSNSDAVYVAAPLWHKFMTQALAGVPDNWYAPPGNVTKGPGGSWYLTSYTKVDHLPGDNPKPSPTPVDYGVPGDPGSGPRPIGFPCRTFPFCPPTPVPPGGGNPPGAG
jgi:membrane peptidoglycan carboxypeptidase